MAMEESDNFFSRWSRRKVQVRSGEPLPAEPPVVASSPVVAPAAALAPQPALVVEPPDSAQQPEPVQQVPLPTMDDVARLTPDADFSAFVARGVPAEVRNAAVKKLFSDPHFNVMDGLDIYIDDYSKPSPLTAADMARMVGAQFLKLVEDPDAPPPPTSQPGSTAAAAAESPPQEPIAPVSHEPHDDHADLQLQPDHAARPPGPGQGTG